MYNIKYSINHFTIQFEENAFLSTYKISALRGIIGNTLLKKFCIKNDNCKKCEFKDSCIASNFIEMKLKYRPEFAASDYMPSCVIVCDDEKRSFNIGENLSFTIISLCDSIVLISEIIRALSLAGRTIGLSGYKFNLQNVMNDREEYIICKNKLTLKNINVRRVSDYINNRLQISDEINMIKIMKPFRFKKEGKLSTDINNEDLISLLKKRIISLNALEGNKIDQLGEYNLNITEKQLEWRDIERHSNRQKTSMKLGGLTGYIYVDVSDIKTKELLIAGELLHIGKNTMFGLGDYILY